MHRRTPFKTAELERRWSRWALAEYWNCSDRKIDRMRADGRLGEPIGYVGRSPIWSDAQRLAAEAAGLEAAQMRAVSLTDVMPPNRRAAAR
jgi:hypothetical protein